MKHLRVERDASVRRTGVSHDSIRVFMRYLTERELLPTAESLTAEIIHECLRAEPESWISAAMVVGI